MMEIPAMAKSEYDKLFEHAYDGIQEYDNPLPGWWMAIFAATIVFSAGYMIYYHGGGPGESMSQEYAAEMKNASEQASKMLAAAPTPTEEIIKQATTKPETAAAGKTVYEGKCAACHGMHGEGLVGPNLTDDYWIHGTGKMLDLYTVIDKGVPEKGMIAWGSQLKPIEITQVVAYIVSLHGSNPPNAKAPQGNKISP